MTWEGGKTKTEEKLQNELTLHFNTIQNLKNITNEMFVFRIFYCVMFFFCGNVEHSNVFAKFETHCVTLDISFH